jgi:hypothetical protein
MEGTALLYVVAIAVTAQTSGWHYLMFPALAALSADVLTRPWGRWASQPGRLVVTPTLGAGIGTLVTRQIPYGFLMGIVSVLLVVTLCLLLLAVLKSNIAPAIAAGLLPLALGIRSWLFPLSVMVGLVVLVLMLLPWQQYYRRMYGAVPLETAGDIDDLLETRPTGNRWVFPFFLFLTIMAICSTTSGLRLVLFPPLVVIAYEMFAHPASCPWARKPLTLPLACFLTATTGWIAVSLFGKGGIAAGCSMAVGIVALRLLQLHMPPALAVGLLPLVINSPSIEYPVSVTIGAVALTLAFLFYRRWVVGTGRAGASVSPNMRSA